MGGVIETGTLSTALHAPRRVWVDRFARKAGFVGPDMPEYVKRAMANA